MVADGPAVQVSGGDMFELPVQVCAVGIIIPSVNAVLVSISVAVAPPPPLLPALPPRPPAPAVPPVAGDPPVAVVPPVLVVPPVAEPPAPVGPPLSLLEQPTSRAGRASA